MMSPNEKLKWLRCTLIKYLYIHLRSQMNANNRQILNHDEDWHTCLHITRILDFSFVSLLNVSLNTPYSQYVRHWLYCSSYDRRWTNPAIVVRRIADPKFNDFSSSHHGSLSSVAVRFYIQLQPISLLIENSIMSNSYVRIYSTEYRHS